MLVVLLIVYQIKHFVCDYLLQGKYMLGKFKDYPGFIKPLLAHSAVHGVATFVIALFFKPVAIALLLGLLDMGSHFLIDRVKASPKMLGKYKALSVNEFIVLQGEIKELYRLAPDGHYEITQRQRKFKENTYFWYSLGLDQMAHHLTHYGIILFLVGV